MTLPDYLLSRTKLINDTLSTLVESPLAAPHLPLYEAARYSLLAPGKRLRPLLTLATVESLSGPLEHALNPACAIEMIHTYSLIHDDLPCMDNDDLRRGKPTLHKVYTEGHAVLTGDYLLTYAFEVIANSPHLLPEQKLQLVRILAQRAGCNGMIGGQAVDIASEGKKIDWELLHFIHLNKTGALIAASFEFGGVIAQASSQEMGLLQTIGEQIGLAFQIIDDILDVTADESSLGKPLFSDLANEKTTSVSLLGLEKAKSHADGLLENASSLCRELALSSSILEELLKKMIFRSY